MLKALLDRIAQGGTWTVESLARELDTTPALVDMMLDDLERQGHLKRVQAGCSSHCASCPLSAAHRSSACLTSVSVSKPKSGG
jgi:DeoR/GlpR family transcriptional regulator of sugar metabolism